MVRKMVLAEYAIVTHHVRGSLTDRDRDELQASRYRKLCGRNSRYCGVTESNPMRPFRLHVSTKLDFR